ncbi:hypothetical protein CWC21_21660 [Pseudoalteromonas phenolica]|nr:hypothetical protein CWC21_21660 [Pseudoalteromonas phenolica]
MGVFATYPLTQMKPESKISDSDPFMKINDSAPFDSRRATVTTDPSRIPNKSRLIKITEQRVAT